MSSAPVVAQPSATEARRDPSRRLGRESLPALAVLAAATLTAFAWILHAQLQRLYGLTAPGWDLGQGQQVLWSLANGHGWASSYEYGKNFFGIHIEPILLPIAGLEMIWPTPVVPLVVSAVGLAATAPAGYLMFRALLGDHVAARWLAIALAAPMPFWASTQEAARDQFHPENLALALALLAVWAGLRQRKVLLWVLVVGTLCCKEDQTYTALVIGLVVLRFGGDSMKAHARRIMMLAVSWLFIGVALLTKLAAGAATPGLIYYWWMLHGGTNYFLQAVSRPDPWVAIVALLAGLLALPFLAPRWLLLALPTLAASLLSDHEPMERLQLHYALLVMFPVIVAAGVGARRLLERRNLPGWAPASALLVGALPALVIGWAAGRLPPALGAEAWLYAQPDAVSRLLAATSVIPAGAPVSADDGDVVWLSNRTRVGIFYGAAQDERYVVIDREAYAHRGDLVPGRADAIAKLQASGRPLLVDDGRFVVWGPLGNR
jgi:uncharacterized membrane protein